jgi:predicted N-acetyltransferase YhbS
VTNPEAGLEAVTAADAPVEHMVYMACVAFNKMYARMMPLGARMLYVFGIAVAPAHHGRGVGAALVRWVNAAADADGVGACVKTSQTGRRVFAANGYAPIDALTVDLDKYATVPRIVDGEAAKWGEYTFTALVRPPKASGA